MSAILRARRTVGRGIECALPAHRLRSLRAETRRDDQVERGGQGDGREDNVSHEVLRTAPWDGKRRVRKREVRASPRHRKRESVTLRTFNADSVTLRQRNVRTGDKKGVNVAPIVEIGVGHVYAGGGCASSLRVTVSRSAASLWLQSPAESVRRRPSHARRPCAGGHDFRTVRASRCRKAVKAVAPGLRALDGTGIERHNPRLLLDRLCHSADAVRRNDPSTARPVTGGLRVLGPRG